MEQKILTYNELIKFKTFIDRYEYLNLNGVVWEDTFSCSRYLNQMLYHLPEWLEIRNKIIIRDDGCDLGISSRKIEGHAYIHHINPITKEQILNRDPCILDPNNLISTSYLTHKAIHYGNKDLLLSNDIIERFPNDTKLW